MAPANPDFTGAAPVGVVLAGGASRRMGRDKTAIRTAGATFAERSVELLRHACPEVLVADRGRDLVRGTASVADGPGAGPAAGLLGAAAARPGRDLLVLACDLPRVPAELLRFLAQIEGGDWVVPERGGRGLEPLCALYRRRALDALADQVDRGVYALHRLAEAPGLELRTIGRAQLEAFGRPAEIFWNVNTPDDLASLRRAGLDG